MEPSDAKTNLPIADRITKTDPSHAALVARSTSADSTSMDEESGCACADSTTIQGEEDGILSKKENNFDEVPKPTSALEKVDFERGSHNRVKLYVLCGQSAWDDRGTGHVVVLQSPESSNTWCIIVRLESNEKNVLESKIQFDTLYQKQQGTLIVWSETDACDLALSFQEKAGCSELWEKICRIQGKDPDAETEEENECDEQEPSDSSTSGISNACQTGVSIPPCDLSHLADLEHALSSSMFASSQREKMATLLQQNGYIVKLCDLFELCEDLEDVKVLNNFASIAKNLFLLNSNAILNELIDEKVFKKIVGMLEYDSAFLIPKRHREFLWKRSKFREVLPISSEDLRAKIHQTFRLQYVQDVCLPAPSIFEENLLTVLTSHLFFIRAEIVTSLLNDKELMQRLFEELRNPAIDSERQRDLTNFLKEFCSFAHSLQPTGPQGKEQFFKTLIANDVLSTIDPCISSPLPTTRSATVELLTIIVDFNPQLFRDFLLRQSRQEGKNSELLINKLISHMLSDRDAEFTGGGQMSQVLRILLDPEGIMAKGEKGEFLQMFYKRSMQTLCTPIIENAKDGRPICDNYYTANQTALVIDLLCFFVEHHSYNMRTHCVQKNLLQSILVFLKSKHHFLSLCALRLVRRIIGLKDDVYVKYICEKCILDPVVECFAANGTRYNLLNSSLIELFEYIKTERLYPLVDYTMRKHWDQTFCRVNYVQTFTKMHDIWEAHEANRENNVKENVQDTSPMPTTTPNAQWRKEREHDDEELFFSREDDEEMPVVQQYRKSGVEPLFPSLIRKRKASDDDSVASIFGGNITPPAGSATASRLANNKIIIRMRDQQSAIPIRFGFGNETEKSTPVSEPSTSICEEKVVNVKRLVDYEDSDSDDDEDEEDAKKNAKNRTEARKMEYDDDIHPSASGVGGEICTSGTETTDEYVRPQQQQSNKLPEFSPSDQTDPPSPPPDPTTTDQMRTSGEANSGCSDSGNKGSERGDKIITTF